MIWFAIYSLACLCFGFVRFALARAEYDRDAQFAWAGFATAGAGGLLSVAIAAGVGALL